MVTNKRAKWLHSRTEHELETMMKDTINKRCDKRIKLFRYPDTILDFHVEFLDETKLIKSVTLQLQFIKNSPLITKLDSKNYTQFSKCVADKFYFYIRKRILEMLHTYNKVYGNGIYGKKYLSDINSKLISDNIEINVTYKNKTGELYG